MLHEHTLSDGNIVAFRPVMTNSRHSSPPPEAERGMILLFTGTRYERPPSEPSFVATRTASEPRPIGREGH